MKKAYRCVECGKRIPAERVYSAISRGQKPKYDTDICKNRALQQRYRDRQRTERK